MAESSKPTKEDYVLATRRALLGDPLSLDVQAWMRPLYIGPMNKLKEHAAKTAVAGIVTVLAKMVSTVDPELKKQSRLQTAYREVTAFISAPLSSEYAKAFQTVKRPDSSVLSTFVSVVYARAVVLLLSSSMDGPKIIADLAETLGNPGSAIDKFMSAQQKLDKNFVGHLVTLSEIEAQIDPHFQGILSRANRLFVETHGRKQTMPNPLADPKSDLHLLKDTESWLQLPATVAFAMTVAS